LDDAPEYSYVANAILSAFNVIARARPYTPQGTPLALDADNIRSYLDLHEAPCELHILVSCVFALDNLYLDGAYKKLRKSG
jgi:hypothetical protein